MPVSKPGPTGVVAGSSPACSTLGSDVRLLGAHLRIAFQLLLAPIFMLGALLAGGEPTFALALSFIAVHAGIYGGMTAFNSYYDRDRGPIAFMKRPVPATPFVRDAALAIQLGAVILLLLLRPAAAGPALALVAMGIAYSHPRWRWKAHLGASLFAVSVGQGILAFAIGYLAGGGPAAGLREPRVAAAALGAALVTLGLYPVTQVYQIEEDRARGDRTLAIAIGWRGALLVSAVVLAAGVGLLLGALAGRIAPFWSVVLPAGVLGLWGLFGLWARRFEQLDAYRNHDWALGLGIVAASVFWLLIVSEWIRHAR